MTVQSVTSRRSRCASRRRMSSMRTSTSVHATLLARPRPAVASAGERRGRARAAGHRPRPAERLGSYCADFVVDAGEPAGAHALGWWSVMADRVRLLQYAPLGSDTDRGGQRLLARADFMVNSDVHTLARHAVPGRIRTAMRRRSLAFTRASTGRSAPCSRATRRCSGGCGRWKACWAMP